MPSLPPRPTASGESPSEPAAPHASEPTAPSESETGASPDAAATAAGLATPRTSGARPPLEASPAKLFGLPRNLALGLAVVVALGLAALVFTLLTGPDEGGGRTDTKARAGDVAVAKRPRGSLCRKLKCTAAQKESVVPAVRKYRKEVRGDERSIRQQWATVAALYSEDDLDATKIDSALAELSSHQSAIDRRAWATLAEIQPHLTTTQRETLAKLIALSGPAGSLSETAARAKPKKRRRKRKSKARPGAGPPPSDAATEADEFHGVRAPRKGAPKADEAPESDAEAATGPS